MKRRLLGMFILVCMLIVALPTGWAVEAEEVDSGETVYTGGAAIYYGAGGVTALEGTEITASIGDQVIGSTTTGVLELSTTETLDPNVMVRVDYVLPKGWGFRRSGRHPFVNEDGRVAGWLEFTMQEFYSNMQNEYAVPCYGGTPGVTPYIGTAKVQNNGGLIPGAEVTVRVNGTVIDASGPSYGEITVVMADELNGVVEIEMVLPDGYSFAAADADTDGLGRPRLVRTVPMTEFFNDDYTGGWVWDITNAECEPIAPTVVATAQILCNGTALDGAEIHATIAGENAGDTQNGILNVTTDKLATDADGSLLVCMDMILPEGYRFTSENSLNDSYLDAADGRWHAYVEVKAKEFFGNGVTSWTAEEIPASVLHSGKVLVLNQGQPLDGAEIRAIMFGEELSASTNGVLEVSSDVALNQELLVSVFVTLPAGYEFENGIGNLFEDGRMHYVVDICTRDFFNDGVALELNTRPMMKHTAVFAQYKGQPIADATITARFEDETAPFAESQNGVLEFEYEMLANMQKNIVLEVTAPEGYTFDTTTLTYAVKDDIAEDFKYFNAKSYTYTDANDDVINEVTAETAPEIAVSGKEEVIPGGTTLEVEEITEDAPIYEKIADAVAKEKLDAYMALDLTLWYEEAGEREEIEGELHGYVTVSIPVPDNMLGKTIVVFRVDEDGTLTQYTPVVKDGVATFATNHFSTYMLAVKAKAPETKPETKPEPKPEPKPQPKPEETKPAETPAKEPADSIPTTSPQTGDGMHAELYGMLMMVILCGALAVNKKRMNR